MQAMQRYIEPSIGRYLPGAFGVIPSGDSSAYAQTQPQQAASGIYGGVQVDGFSIDGRLSAGLLAAMIVVLIVFHVGTKPLQL